MLYFISISIHKNVVDEDDAATEVLIIRIRSVDPSHKFAMQEDSNVIILQTITACHYCTSMCDLLNKNIFILRVRLR